MESDRGKRRRLGRDVSASYCHSECTAGHFYFFLPLTTIRAERAVPKLSRFIKGYQTYVRDIVREDSVTFRPTRVAVIDNGILSISPLVDTPSAISNAANIFETPSALNLTESSDITSIAPNGYQTGKDGEYKTLWSRIKKGRSFVDDESRVSSWLFASDPHGTQMANLICAIDPCCDLYVAKVAEGRSGIIPARVERVSHDQVDETFFFSPSSDSANSWLLRVHQGC